MMRVVDWLRVVVVVVSSPNVLALWWAEFAQELLGS